MSEQFIASTTSQVNVGNNFFLQQGDIGKADHRIELECDVNHVWRYLKMKGLPITDSDDVQSNQGGGDLAQSTSGYGDAISVFRSNLDEFIKSNWSNLLDANHSNAPFESQMVAVLDSLFGDEDLKDAPAQDSGERQLSTAKINAWTQGYGDTGSFGNLVFTDDQIAQIMVQVISSGRYVADTYDANGVYVADGSGENKSGHILLSEGDMIGVRILLTALNNDSTQNTTNQMTVHLLLKQKQTVLPRMDMLKNGSLTAQGHLQIAKDTVKDTVLGTAYITPQSGLTVRFDLFHLDSKQVPDENEQQLFNTVGVFDLQYKIDAQRFPPIRIEIISV